MKSQLSEIVLAAIGLLVLTISNTALPATELDEVKFAVNLFDAIAEKNTSRNIIISPVAIRTALALTYLGAVGRTAEELGLSLKMGDKNFTKEDVSKEFKNLLIIMKNNATTTTIRMANRIFVTEKYSIKNKFNDVAKTYFNTEAENVNFTQINETVKKINNWIANQTENKIQNILATADISADTAAVLVNAIYFKAEWHKPFNSNLTHKKDFYLNKTLTKPVDMMSGHSLFHYGDLKDLDAKALVLKYRGSDLKMLLLLPNEVEGLAQLEMKLKSMSIVLTELAANLTADDIGVHIPKFKFDFDISLQEALEKLGIHELFFSSADLSELLNDSNVAVSKIIHKALIAVDELGTEATAAKAIGTLKKSSPVAAYHFIADHPFFFAVLDQHRVYFTGQVVNI